MAGSLVGVASTNFAYFYWYSVVRTLYLKYAKAAGQPSTVVELSLGAAAGALAQLFTIPVAVITTRQQTQRKEDRKGFFDTAREVVEGEDGVSGLWRGLKASLVLVINPSITYGAYERLKDVLFPGKKNLSPWEAFALGAMSKALATLITQPLIVAKVGLQSKPPPARQGKPFKSFVEVMQFIIENEGPLSLFKGMGPQILKGLLVQGILMMTKERYVVTNPCVKSSKTNSNCCQCRAHVCPLRPLSPGHAVAEARAGRRSGRRGQARRACDHQIKAPTTGILASVSTSGRLSASASASLGTYAWFGKAPTVFIVKRVLLLDIRGMRAASVHE